MGPKRREEMSDRELLVRIDERQEVMAGRLDNHGDRIRTLEVGVVSALIGGLMLAKDFIVRKLGAQ